MYFHLCTVQPTVVCSQVTTTEILEAKVTLITQKAKYLDSLCATSNSYGRRLKWVWIETHWWPGEEKERHSNGPDCAQQILIPGTILLHIKSYFYTQNCFSVATTALQGHPERSKGESSCLRRNWNGVCCASMQWSDSLWFKIIFIQHLVPSNLEHHIQSSLAFWDLPYLYIVHIGSPICTIYR